MIALSYPLSESIFGSSHFYNTFAMMLLHLLRYDISANYSSAYSNSRLCSDDLQFEKLKRELLVSRFLLIKPQNDLDTQPGLPRFVFRRILNPFSNSVPLIDNLSLG